MTDEEWTSQQIDDYAHAERQRGTQQESEQEGDENPQKDTQKREPPQEQKDSVNTE